MSAVNKEKHDHEQKVLTLSNEIDKKVQKHSNILVWFLSDSQFSNSHYSDSRISNVKKINKVTSKNLTNHAIYDLVYI